MIIEPLVDFFKRVKEDCCYSCREKILLPLYPFYADGLIFIVSAMLFLYERMSEKKQKTGCFDYNVLSTPNLLRFWGMSCYRKRFILICVSDHIFLNMK